MNFPISATLLDALVLAVVNTEDTYGYKITQEIRNVVVISESTLYPVLRRLLSDSCLETYDEEYMGRNRRYYRITNKGKSMLKLYFEEWALYKARVDRYLGVEKVG